MNIGRCQGSKMDGLRQEASNFAYRRRRTHRFVLFFGLLSPIFWEVFYLIMDSGNTLHLVDVTSPYFWALDVLLPFGIGFIVFCAFVYSGDILACGGEIKQYYLQRICVSCANLSISLEKYDPLVFQDLKKGLLERVCSLKKNVTLLVDSSMEGQVNAAHDGESIILTLGLLDLPFEQVEAILAHEFGHLCCEHNSKAKKWTSVIWKTLVVSFSVSLSWILYAAYNPHISSFLFWILLTLEAMILFFKIQSVSKDILFEREADTFAYRSVENPENYALALTSLVNRNRLSFSTSWFEQIFITGHPSPDKRIIRAKDFIVK